jgi:hypothetical protein
VGQNLEIRAHPPDQIADHDPVEHAEGVVGDDHHRSDGRDRAQARLVVVDLQLELAYGGVPERLAHPRLPLVCEIHALETRLAGQPLDGSDRDPAQRRIIGARIAEQQAIGHPPLRSCEIGRGTYGWTVTVR